MNLSETYPKLFAQLDDEEMELRHLLSIDENELDYDSEEFEFDVDEFNYIVYVAEPVQQILGEEKMQTLIETLADDTQMFENFFASELDLYGVKSSHENEKITSHILDTIERML